MTSVELVRKSEQLSNRDVKSGGMRLTEELTHAQLGSKYKLLDLILGNYIKYFYKLIGRNIRCKLA